MTYKELVDRIEDAVTRHKMLVDFGYGQLSDIKVLDNSDDGADYPYAFLLPTGIARANQAVTYSFSLIVMEMALNPRQILEVQSNCVQYINDLIADLRFDSTFDGDVSLTQSIQVFRERFQDEVAGATLNLQVTVADQINECEAPFSELVHTDTAYQPNRDVWYNSTSVGTRLFFPSWQIPREQAFYRIKGFVQFATNRALTDDAAPYDVPFIVFMQDADTPRFIREIEFDGSADMVGQPQTVNFDFTVQLEDVDPDNNDLSFTFGYSSGGNYPDSTIPATAYDDAIYLTNGELEIYKG